jgi:bifunctional enzyme CysN/CysC
VPVSALKGDNVVERSHNTPWYEGSSLLHHLEEVHIASDRNLIDCRFPVQYVIRPRDDAHHDYRGYAGQVASGTYKVGDDVVVLPSGFESRIAAIDGPEGPLDEASPPLSVTLRLEDDLDVSRGDMISRPNNRPHVGQDVDAMLCWFSERAQLQSGGKYAIKHTSRWARAMVKDLHYRLDVNTLSRDESATTLSLNEIGRVTLRTTLPLFFDDYRRNRATGSFVLVDEATNDTLAAGMIL